MGNEADSSNLEFLISAGLPRGGAVECLRRANGDIARAIEEWSKIQGSWQEPPSKPPTSVNQPAGGAANPHVPVGLTQDILTSALQQAAGTPAGKANDVDDDLAKALALSKQEFGGSGPEPLTKEEREMQLALAASLKSANQMEVDQTGFGLSADEMQIQQAVERSLLESGVGSDAVSLVSNNPNHRKREGGLPVGLRNVGNTCYFNSLLQTYFYIPSLRQAILSFPADEAAKKTDKAATVDFMKELQRIFAYFLFTNQKWVDPSALLKKILDRNGTPVNIGNQEDVSEFNELFLERIAEGLDLTSKLTNSKNNSEMIKNMFQGLAVEYLNAHEADGSPIETTQDGVVVAHLILPVVEEEKDLYEALDSYMVDAVNYTTEKGHATVAEQSRWFKKLPPVLMLQQNRVKFDVASGSYRKLNTPLRFDPEVFMDRYFLEQREQTTQVRRVVTQWRSDLNVLDKNIKAITNYKGRSHGLPEALQSAADYLSEKEGDDGLAASIQLLNTFYKLETDKLKQLQEEAQVYRTKIAGAYDQFPRKASYSLFAVWIHAGVAGSGHYWAYIRAGKRKRPAAAAPAPTAVPGETEDSKAKDKEPMQEVTADTEPTEGAAATQELEMIDKEEEKEWLKFNDILVTEADAATVFADAIGGSGTATGYFLIYVETDTLKAIQEAFLPDAETDGQYLSTKTIKDEIEADNVKFLETVEKFNMSASEDKVTQFKNTYENKLAEAKQYTEDAIYTANVKDLRIKSFYAFLTAIGMEDMARNEIIKDVYVQTFEKGLEKDMDSSYYKKVSDLIGEDNTQLAIASVFDNAADVLRKEFQDFRKTAQLYTAGLNFFLERRHDQAMNAFKLALVADNQVEHMEVKRATQIMCSIKFCLHRMAEEAKQKLVTGNYVDALPLLNRSTLYAVQLLDRADPFFVQLKSEITGWYNSRAFPITDEGYNRLNQAVGTLLAPAFAVKQLDPTPLSLPDYGRGETEKWEGVARRQHEHLTALQEQAPHLWLTHMPIPPERPPAAATNPAADPQSGAAATSTSTSATSSSSSASSHASHYIA